MADVTLGLCRIINEIEECFSLETSVSVQTGPGWAKPSVLNTDCDWSGAVLLVSDWLRAW